MLDRAAKVQPRTSAHTPLRQTLTTLWSRFSNPRLPSWISAALMFFGVLVPEAASIHFLGVNSPVWLTNAVGVAILFRNAPATWPCLILVQLLADGASGMLVGDGAVISFGTALCDTVEIIATSVALHAIGRGGFLFSSVGRIVKFAAVCLVTPVFSAAGSALLLHATLDVPLDEAGLNWYLSATFGLLILTPFLVMWTEPGRFSTASPWVRAEILLLTAVVGAVGWIDFSVRALPGMFISFPFLIVAAFRGGLLGATSAAVALIVVASSLTFAGHGEIANYPDTTSSSTFSSSSCISARSCSPRSPWRSCWNSESF
jgi:integral membrane sensor domain MASE1